MMTFEDTYDRQNATTPIGLQILNQAELVEATSVDCVKEAINQHVIEG
jgi:hypothetical protein